MIDLKLCKFVYACDIIGVRMFMQINIFLNGIKGVRPKQRLDSCSKYYNWHFT